MKHEGQEAKSAVKQAGEALEEGFVAAVQAPRHLAETVKCQVGCRFSVHLDAGSKVCAFGCRQQDCYASNLAIKTILPCLDTQACRLVVGKWSRVSLGALPVMIDVQIVKLTAINKKL